MLNGKLLPIHPANVWSTVYVTNIKNITRGKFYYLILSILLEIMIAVL